MSLHLISVKCSEVEKVGSSSSGAYKLTIVSCFSFPITSQIINHPSGSQYVLEIWKVKLLLNNIITPAFVLVQQLKRAWYPHSARQSCILFSVQWPSWIKYIDNCFFRSQLKSSRRLVLSPKPLAFIDPVIRSISFCHCEEKRGISQFSPKE